MAAHARPGSLIRARPHLRAAGCTHQPPLLVHRSRRGTVTRAPHEAAGVVVAAARPTRRGAVVREQPLLPQAAVSGSADQSPVARPVRAALGVGAAGAESRDRLRRWPARREDDHRQQRAPRARPARPSGRRAARLVHARRVSFAARAGAHVCRSTRARALRVSCAGARPLSAHAGTGTVTCGSRKPDRDDQAHGRSAAPARRDDGCRRRHDGEPRSARSRARGVRGAHRVGGHRGAGRVDVCGAVPDAAVGPGARARHSRSVPDAAAAHACIRVSRSAALRIARYMRVLAVLALVACSSPSSPSLPPVETKRPIDAREVAQRWLAGDLHMHLAPRDPAGVVGLSVVEIAAAATKAGMDFVVLTPHLWPARWPAEWRQEWSELAKTAAAIGTPIMIPGVEWTTRDGHFTVAGIDLAALRGDDFLAAADAAGAFISVNHPFAVPTKIGGIRASHYDMSYRPWTQRAQGFTAIDGAEVWNIPLAWANLISRPGGATGEQLAWAELDRIVHEERRRVTAVAGTDNHKYNVMATTWVLAAEASATAILEALRDGRTCIGGPEAGTLRARGDG